MDSLKKRFDRAEQKTRMLEFCAKTLIDWMAESDPEGLEAIHAAAWSSMRDVLEDAEAVAARETLMNLINVSGWERAIAAGRLEWRIQKEADMTIEAYPNRSPLELAAGLEAQAWHPAGPDVQKRIVAALRSRQEGKVN